MADYDDDDRLDDEDNGPIPALAEPPGAPGEMAKLNITWAGNNGDLPDPVGFDLDDASVKRIATESVRDGYVPGIPAAAADFKDFVVERFRANEAVPANRIMLRPKTPFGC